MGWAVVVGLLVGLSLGALGGGGSILTVPALVYLVGEPPSTATATSLVVVGLTAMSGAASHTRSGRVRWRDGLTFGGVGVVGAWLGSQLSASVPPRVLMGAFAALTLVVAVVMLRRAQGMTPADNQGVADASIVAATDPAAHLDPHPAAHPDPHPAAHLDSDDPVVAAARASETVSAAGGPAGSGGVRHTRWGQLILAGTGVGLLTGFFGVGGGFAVVPALVLALGFSMPTAVGTSLVVIAVNSAAALLSRVAGGVDIDVPVVVAFTAAAIGASMLGARLAHRTSPRALTRSFALLLVVVGLYTAYRSLVP